MSLSNGNCYVNGIAFGKGAVPVARAWRNADDVASQAEYWGRVLEHYLPLALGEPEQLLAVVTMPVSPGAGREVHMVNAGVTIWGGQPSQLCIIVEVRKGASIWSKRADG